MPNDSSRQAPDRDAVQPTNPGSPTDAEPPTPSDERALLTWLRWAEAELKRMLLAQPVTAEDPIGGDPTATDLARRAYRAACAHSLPVGGVSTLLLNPPFGVQADEALKIVTQLRGECEFRVAMLDLESNSEPTAAAPEPPVSSEQADQTDLPAQVGSATVAPLVLPEPKPDGTNPFEVISWILFTYYVAARHLTEARQQKVAELGRKMRTEEWGGVEYLHWEDDVDRREVEKALHERTLFSWSKALCDARNLCAEFRIPFDVYDPLLKAASDKMADLDGVIRGVASDKEVYCCTDIEYRLHDLAHSTTPPTSARPSSRREGEPTGPNIDAVALLTQFLVERFRDGHLYAPYVLLRKVLMDAGCADEGRVTELTDRAMNELYLRGFVTPDPARRVKWPIDWEILPAIVSANTQAGSADQPSTGHRQQEEGANAKPAGPQGEGAGKDDQRTPSLDDMPERARLAYLQHRQAVRALVEEDGRSESDVTDDDAYQHLTDAEVGNLPAVDTWKRNLRTAREALGQQKKKRRPKYDGRSAAPPEHFGNRDDD